MNQVILKSFGEVIERLRERKGLTQVQLGKKCKLSQAVISRIEVGKTGTSIPILFKLSKGLGKNPDRIIYLLRSTISNKVKRKK